MRIYVAHAIYGFVRSVFDRSGAPSWWWSIPVSTIAGVTTVMGVLYALMEHDLKRLLAYHTVENIGIIFIGLGLALAFKSEGMLFAAALAFYRRASACVQPFPVQELAIFRRGRRAHCYRRARHGTPRWPHSSHAADRFRFSDWRRAEYAPNRPIVRHPIQNG